MICPFYPDMATNDTSLPFLHRILHILRASSICPFNFKTISVSEAAKPKEKNQSTVLFFCRRYRMKWQVWWKSKGKREKNQLRQVKIIAKRVQVLLLRRKLNCFGTLTSDENDRNFVHWEEWKGCRGFDQKMSLPQHTLCDGGFLFVEYDE